MPIEKTESLTENLDLADHLLTASSLRFRCADGWWLLPHRVVSKNTPPSLSNGYLLRQHSH